MQLIGFKHCSRWRGATDFFGLILACLILFSGFAHAAWPVKKYEIRQSLNPISERIAPDQVDNIEALLNAYAEEFSRQGWPAPKHEAMNFSKTAYLVFVEEYATPPNYDQKKNQNRPYRGGPPRIVNDCENAALVTKIQVDPRWWNDGLAKSTDKVKLWQDLAHEQFHTIQLSYPMFSNCSSGKKVGYWIHEGTAEAVGIEMARKIAGVQPNSLCQIGARGYHKSLYFKHGYNVPGCGGAQEAYQTNSFWQFLGEWKVRNSPPTPTRTTWPDYFYLDHFFKIRPISYDAAGEYSWLNKVLLDKDSGRFGFSLREAYTNFVSSFAGYYPAREDDYNKDFKPSPDRWHGRLFGSCRLISPQNGPPQLISILLQPMSSRCFKIHTPGGGQHAIEVTARGDISQLRHLTISTENGKQRYRPSMKPNAAPDRATFRFNIGGTAANEHYFIVANAAENPIKNSVQTVKISVVLADSDSNSAEANKDKTKKRKRKDSSDEAYGDEYEANQNVDSWQGYVRQVQPGRKCEKAFVDRICGERTKIILTLRPEQLSAIASSLENLSAVDASRRAGQVGDKSEIDRLLSHEKHLAETEGSKVQIEIPRIDYNFSGSFANAFIRMNKPLTAERKQGHYDTKGPEWRGSCGEGGHAYSGKVTIEESSVQVLRGTFEGAMVDPGMRSKYYCRAMPVYRQISGVFSILSPDLDKKSQEREIDSEQLVDQVLDEAAAMVPGMLTPQAREEIKKKAKEAADRNQQRKQKKKAERAANIESCDCRCDRAGQNMTKPGCYEKCEASYQQCKAPSADQIKMLYDINRSPTDEEVQAFATMRAEIVDWLKKEPKKYIQETWLNQYDSAPHYMKQTVYDQIKALYAE